MADFRVLSIDIAQENAANLFAESLKNTGFAVLRNHGIPSDEIETMYAGWARWFNGSEKEAFAVKPGQSNGYFGYKSENAKGAAHKDLKEFFHVYQDKPIPQSVEEVTRSFNQKLINIGAMLLKWLDEVTAERVSFSEPLAQMIEGSKANLLRVLHYPPLPKDIAPGEMRAAAHGDINLITLLVAGSEPGLQAQDRNGDWHDIPTEAGYIAVNAGDMLEQASKGYFPSTPHRVMNPTDHENRARYSMPLFIHPRPEVRLDHQTAGAFLDERLKEIGLK